MLHYKKGHHVALTGFDVKNRALKAEYKVKITLWVPGAQRLRGVRSL